jgi:CheY-like chemotaxis protein
MMGVRMQIVVVDDDPMAAEMISLMLEEAGHQPLLASDGMAAIELIEKGCDLVVSDMNMPLMSGIELFQTLREGGVDVPFLLLTGDDPGPYMAMAPGLNGCLMKDDDLFDRLVSVVDSYAGGGL